MATSQYQSVDPKLVAKKGKKPMSSVSTTQAPVFQSLETKSQQPQAPSSAGLPLIGGGQTIKGVGLQAVNTPVRSAMDNFTPISRQPSTQPTTQGSTQGPAQPTIQATTNARVRERLSKMGGDIVLRGKGLADIRATYPEFAHIDDETFKKIGGDIALRGKGIDDILQAYPELLVGGQVGERPRAEQGGVKGFLGEVAQPLKTLGQGLAGLTEKAGDYLMSSNDGTPVGIATDKAISEAGYQTNVTRGFVPQKTQEDIKQENKTLSQNILDTVEGTAYLAGQIYAPITSAIFQAGSKVPVVKDVLGKVGEGFSRVGEKLKYIPGYNQYRESLPPEDQNRLDALAGNMIAAFIGSKGKGKITQGDVKGYIMDNFGSPGSLDRAFGEQLKSTYSAVKSKIPAVKSNFVAKKLIDSKLKITAPNKKLVEKASGVPASEFILNNDLGAGTVDDMIQRTQQLGDEAMSAKLQAFEQVKTPQPITQREKLMANSIINQAKNDIGELYGKAFDEITPDEVLPELKEQFNIVSNLEDLMNSKETTATKLQALQSLYDMYNSHLKYDLSKKRILSSQEQIRLGMQKQLEELGNTVGVDIKELNKKISGAKALEKSLVQAESRMDNNNMFGLSDTQTAILGAALGGGPVGVTLGLMGKGMLDNLGVRTKLAKFLYTKPKVNEGGKMTVNTPNNRPTARGNVSAQFGGSDTAMNSSKPNTTVVVPRKNNSPTQKGNGAKPKVGLGKETLEQDNLHKVVESTPDSILKQRKGIVKDIPVKDLLDFQDRGNRQIVDHDIVNSLKKGYDRKQPIDFRIFEDGSATVADGNGRMLAAKELGMETIPVRITKVNLDPKFFTTKQFFTTKPIPLQTIKNNALKQKGNGAKPKVGLGKETLEQNIDDSLIQEAGKYKSADEFVNSNKNQGYETSRMNKNYKSFIDSKEFKDRFGDSKAITRGGYVSPDRPTSYYHASPNKFDTFETRKNLIDKGIDMPDYRDTDSGIYFSTKPINDDYYGKNKYEVLLNIKNPFNTNSDISVLSDEKIAGYIRKGYDAVVSPTETVVFSPKQIKIITRNKEPVGQYKDYIRKIREQANKKPLPLKKK